MPRMVMRAAFIAGIILPACAAPAAVGGEAPRPPQAVEIGTVRWTRDFDGALRKASGTGRPVFALFQEVPGCAGCQQFGREVLSHPDMVEIIEKNFIPVLIYNNRPGRDAELLERFGEPAWNYQVVRFLDAAGRDLIPRRDRVWSVAAVASRMAEALRAAGREVPPSLDGLGKASPGGP